MDNEVKNKDPHFFDVFVEFVMEKRDFIHSTEAIKLIAKKTGKTKASVSGSCFMQGPRKFFNRMDFLTEFGFVATKPKGYMIYRRSYAEKYGIELDVDVVDYNNLEKAKARELTFRSVKSLRYPKVVTFPNRNGYDVNYIKALNPNAIIYGVEHDENILAEYKAKCKFNDIVLYQSDISKFLQQQTNNHFDIIFYDCRSYMAKNMAGDLKLINKHKLSNEIAITLDHLKTPRNKGHYIKMFKIKNKHNEEYPQLEEIFEYLSNYQLLEELHYIGCHANKKSKMVVLKFKLFN